MSGQENQVVSINPTAANSRLKPLNKRRWLFYLASWALANSAILGASFIYFKSLDPSYVSYWSIALPGASTTTNLNLPGIAQASSYNSSPYISEFSDPRETYKFLARTPEVRQLAAEQLGITPREFGSAEVNVIDNTTIMAFEVAGATPEEAQSKAIALQKALDIYLKELREAEIKQNDQTLTAVLATSQKKLEQAQRKLSAFKAQSGLNSQIQVDEITKNSELLWRQQAEIMAQVQQSAAEFNQLSSILGLSPQQASDALKLQSDGLFQQYLTNYSSVTAELSTLRASLAPSHPTMVRMMAEESAIRTGLLTQAQELIKRPVNLENLNTLNLNQANSSPERAALFERIISLYSQQQGFRSQAQESQRQILLRQERLSGLAQKESRLEALQRDVQIAEGIFSSTLTKLDLSQGQVSAAYPSISAVSKPSLGSPVTSKYTYLVLGITMSSFLLTTGFLLLQFRNPKKNKEVSSNQNVPLLSGDVN